MISVIIALQTTMQKDACGWMVQARIWQHNYDCAINETVDLQKSGTNATPSGIDLSVVNVFVMHENTGSSECVYSMAQLDSAGVVKNGVFFINVSIDVTACTELWISPFDSIYGKLSNVSLLGFINVTGLNAANFNSSIPVRLSKMFGNLFWSGSDRVVGYTGNSTTGTQLNNLNSSLVYYVNGVAITADNQTISGLLKARLVSEFDSTIEGLNAS